MTHRDYMAVIADLLTIFTFLVTLWRLSPEREPSSLPAHRLKEWFLPRVAVDTQAEVVESIAGDMSHQLKHLRKALHIRAVVLRWWVVALVSVAVYVVLTRLRDAFLRFIR